MDKEEAKERLEDRREKRKHDADLQRKAYHEHELNKQISWQRMGGRDDQRDKFS